MFVSVIKLVRSAFDIYSRHDKQATFSYSGKSNSCEILTLVMLNKYVQHSSPIYFLLTCSIPVVSLHFQSGWKTVWIGARDLFTLMTDLQPVIY